MEGSNASNSEKPHLITETLPFSETTFSVLPVIVEGETATLEEIEHNPLEEETILSVPWITLDNGNQNTLLPNSRENQEDSSVKNNVVEVEESVIEAETEAAVDWQDVGIEIEEVTGYPAVFEAHVLQLDGGTLAYIHSHPQDGCQTVQLEDGKVAYITLTQPVTQESTDLKMEEDNSPKKTKSFLCPKVGCGRLYTSSNHLKVHERTHTGSRPYNCTVEGCNKAFSTDYSRKAHIRTHTGEKPYECPEDFCSKSFKTSGDLQKHVRTHTGERPFACPVEGCNRSFTTSNIRKVHIRTHTGERPYVCNHPYCTKAFASATNYKNHIRIHSGEKPYMCNVAGCNKRFTEYSSLYKHHMVHTQEKPYQCNVCGRSYRQASTLTVHKRTSHGMIEADDGTELMLGNVLTQKVINTGNITAEATKTKTIKTIGANVLTNGDFILDSEGSIKKISNEQIFIIEDIPEHLNVLQV